VKLVLKNRANGILESEYTTDNPSIEPTYDPKNESLDDLTWQSCYIPS